MQALDSFYCADLVMIGWERERNALQREIYTCVFESVRGAVPLASVIWEDFLKIPNHTSRRTGDPVENEDQNG
jgi:hypothetical protein